MGQATVDLPDPLDLPPVDPISATPISAAALASADDLLSQLAGDDIDRLLAEAESADPPPAALPETADSSISPAAAEHAELIRTAEQTAVEVADVDVEAATAVAVSEITAPETIAPAIDVPIAADHAFALQAMIEPAASAVESEGSEKPVESVAPIAEVESAPVEAPLAPETPAFDEAASEERHALVEGPSPVAKPPSILVRILQLMNSPLAWLPDPLRDALGKAGLLTMFNAIAVLGYVLLFRTKHPH